MEEELLECRAALGKAQAERDSLHSQATGHLAEIDRLRQVWIKTIHICSSLVNILFEGRLM